MLTWIVLAVLGCALVLLVLSVRPVLSRLPTLRRAVLALQHRQGEVEALALRAEQLQTRVDQLQRNLEAAERRRAMARADRTS
ncbi:hypothetical protein O7623_04910 [Solwaraspora sp. WMMD791]|uniref:hypothetical protein n=1 Tax=Solwaraspora sp. WMMD791 TaxID=3016086 RepID=UPI00249CA97D|nr:hypothetical protein [Solwaraspora sp. WMMD791]WFE28553.1 hypothetical protein O7623_04910 [Solwaraspora sp. WMMD791]